MGQAVRAVYARSTSIGGRVIRAHDTSVPHRWSHCGCCADDHRGLTLFTRDAQAVGRWVLAQQGCPIEPPPGFHALGSMADGQLVSGAIWYPAGDGSAWMHAAFGTPTPSFVCELVDALFVCDALTAVRFDLPPDHDMLKRVVMRLGARPCSAPSEQGYVSYELGKKDIEPWLRLHL